jgi:hypothetical protein
VEENVAGAEGVDQEPDGGADGPRPTRLAVSATWKVMHVSSGKIEAIGLASGPEAPGAVLRIEDREYEVVFSESDRDAGWVYVTNLHLSRLTLSQPEVA